MAKGREGGQKRPAGCRGTLPLWVPPGPAAPQATVKGAGRLSCTPRALPPSLCPPAFPRGRWGAQRGWGAPGRRARLSRAPPPPPLRREFQSERARGLLLGWNHPAPRRRVGRCHLTARPRPPRVRGGGSVCSVTNGPSRPARPLAPARCGPARAHSSCWLPASWCPARRLPAVPATPEGAPGTQRGGLPAEVATRGWWCAAGGLAGECAVWAWDAAGPVRETHGSTDADTGPGGAQVKFLQSEPEVSLQLGLLSLLPWVRCSRKSLDLGEGLGEILVLRYLTKVEKTHQVERVWLQLMGVTQVHGVWLRVWLPGEEDAPSWSRASAAGHFIPKATEAPERDIALL